MTKLATADHVAAISRILSADGWLADHAWSRDEGAFRMDWIEGVLRPTDVLRYADRTAWNADALNDRYSPPFGAGDFKRRSKKRVGDEIMRVFTTPHGGLEAHTFEKDGAVVRVEFHVKREPYSQGVSDLVRTVHAADIPAAPPPAKPTYDVVDAATLEALVIDSAIAQLIRDEEYGSAKEVREDYDPFDLDSAVHTGFPYNRQVEKDLSRIDFSTENTGLDYDPKEVVGIHTIGDLTFLGVFAGGDWELPLLFVLYSDGGKLRGYLPEDGNVFNRATMRAWGNGGRAEEAVQAKAEQAGETTLNGPKLLADIVRHFGLG